MKFVVPILRVGYRQLDIEVEAKNPDEAAASAEDKAGNMDFPAEHHYEYKASEPIPLN
jgi:hypothetical protein